MFILCSVFVEKKAVGDQLRYIRFDERSQGFHRRLEFFELPISNRGSVDINDGLSHRVIPSVERRAA